MDHEQFYDRFFEKQIARTRRRSLLKVGEHLIRYNVLRAIRTHMPGTNHRIIDVGCGRGHLTGMLRPLGTVTGCDGSPVAIDHCRRRYPDIEFLVLDVFDQAWITGHRERFDVVVSTEVIEHLPSKRQAEFIFNLRSLLKVGGILILTTPNRMAADLMKSDPTLSDCAYYQQYEGQPVANLLDERELRDLLRGEDELIFQRTFYPLIRRRAVDLLLKAAALPTRYVLLQWSQRLFKLPGKVQILCLRKCRCTRRIS